VFLACVCFGHEIETCEVVQNSFDRKQQPIWEMRVRVCCVPACLSVCCRPARAGVHLPVITAAHPAHPAPECLSPPPALRHQQRDGASIHPASPRSKQPAAGSHQGACKPARTRLHATATPSSSASRIATPSPPPESGEDMHHADDL